tara:strand:+ start:461 stop:1744 length:1284 start_codon:yes stop_codon:yes gene_type:complete
MSKEILMRVSDILKEISLTAGANAKKAILTEHSSNSTLKKVLLYGSDPFTPFNVVKIPKVKYRLDFPLCEEEAWREYFSILDDCSSRAVTGNAAIDRVYTCFTTASPDIEVWMRKILKKHLAIGASTKTINKVFPGLIPTFDVSLAQKFDMKRILGKNKIIVEPKLDGIRCLGVVQDGQCQLFARSGKLISNFDKTIGNELLKLGDGCYDGELMGDDFVSIMRQAYRKDDINTAGTYLALFDFLPLDEWQLRTDSTTTGKKTRMSCNDRFEELLTRLSERFNSDLEHVQAVDRTILENPAFEDIKELHDKYVSCGFEGAMIKDFDAPYRFGRGYEVMKLKVFNDADLKVSGLLEGTGKHAGKLGSFQVLFNGVEVQVGSGLTDSLRAEIWSDPDSFLGRTIEVRYQEVTPDGSLRFPTFVCFRNDRD